MNGPSPEGTKLDAITDPEARIARTAQGVPTMDQAPGVPPAEPEQGTTGEVAALEAAADLPAAAAEVAQLEALLEARARELHEQRAELARLRSLVRDAVGRFETSVGAAAEPIIGELRRERDLAVARALESEAARADIRFRLDEVMGHLAAAGAAEGALPGERMDVTCARLAGTVRGLVSALAETQEGREMAQARLLLAEQDLLELRTDSRALERERAELREQLELEQLKARRMNEHWRGGLDAPSAASLRGERDGLSARIDESERAFAALTSRIAELEQVVTREIEGRGEAGTALAKAQAERMVLGEELARARADASAARAALEDSQAERDRSLRALAEQLDAAQRGAAEPDPRLSRYADALRDARAELSELGAALRLVQQPVGSRVGGIDSTTGDGAQPAVTTSIEPVEGLELKLAASEDRVRQLEARLASAAATVGGLEASAQSPGAAQQLAALRLLLERR